MVISFQGGGWEKISREHIARGVCSYLNSKNLGMSSIPLKDKGGSHGFLTLVVQLSEYVHNQSFLYHSAVLRKRIMPFYGLVPEKNT